MTLPSSSMSLIRFISASVLLCCCLWSTQGVQTFWPAAVPFVVRTPYLNAWQDPFTAGGSTNNWPFFWSDGFSSHFVMLLPQGLVTGPYMI